MSKKEQDRLSERLRLLMSAAEQICWEWDVRTDRFELIGPQDCLLGFSYGEMPKNVQFWRERVHPEDLEATKNSLAAVLQTPGRDSWNWEHRLIDAHGDAVWVTQAGLVTERDKDGQAISLIGSTRLIEDLKQAQLETSKALEYLEALVESHGDAIARIDENGRITYANHSFRSKFLNESPSAERDSISNLAERCNGFRLLKRYLERMESERITEIATIECLTAEGDVQQFAWSMKTLVNPETQAFELLISGRDESLNKALQDALLESRNAQDAQNEFLASVSHDLRTPLNPIIGYAELIERRPTRDSEVTEMATSIKEAGLRLLDHINSLLEISHLDSGTYAASFESLSAAELRKRIVDTFSIQCCQKGLMFGVQVKGEPDRRFLSDLRVLENILNNLIGNGIKYTESGGVRVSLELRPRDNDKNMGDLAFEVCDDGIGIPEADRERIFEPFKRVASHYHRNIEGVGLGLNLVKKAVEFCSGTIAVESKIDKGTRFHGCVPVVLQAATKGAPTRETEELPAGKALKLDSERALVVDDIDSNRELMRAQLTEFGVAAQSCDGGQAALRELEQSAFTIVFMDLHMPQLSGFEATKALRENKVKPKTAPYLVAATADVTAKARSRCSELGFDDIVTKPITKAKLERVLRKYELRRS